MAYILFSPVGTTDPISQNRDGGLLHICRHYRPKAVHLFYTAEMAAYREKDNRYVCSLEMLEEEIGNHMEITEETDAQLFEVQRFDNFYEIFGKHLCALEKKYPEDEILLNVSSGTPAMKSALQTLAALSQGKYIPIQVSTPIKKSNPKVESLKDYCVDDEWILNSDNEAEAPNRTEISSTLNLQREIHKEILKKHLEVYDYHAALTVAKEIRNISPDVLRLLKIAVSRMQLDQSKVTQLEKDTEFDVIPIKSSDEQSIFEYMLWLQIKAERKEYADFVRGITPVFLDLCELYLKRVYNINLNDYCESRSLHLKITDGTGKTHKIKNTIFYMSRSKLSETNAGKNLLQELDQEFAGSGYRDSDFSSKQAVVWIQLLSKDEAIVKDFKILRDVESTVRNLAAHEIKSITDEWIESRSGYNTTTIMKKLKNITTKTIKQAGNHWSSYNKMNQQIEELLKS